MNEGPGMSIGNTFYAGEWLSVGEVSRILGLSKSGTYGALQHGTIRVPLLRVGKRLLVNRADLDRFIAESTVQPKIAA